MDIFAQIAANGIGGRDDLLYEPQPMKFSKICCELNKKSEPFKVKNKISTKEELYSKLAELRKEYEPYLSDVAPKLDTYKTTIKIIFLSFFIKI